MQENEVELQRTVCVFNLSSCVREEILYELFLQAGPVQKVIIPKDRDGNQKSYGFVYYKHAEAVPYAIALLDGIWLYGCPITLKCQYGQMHRVRDDFSWRDWMSGLSIGPFSPPLYPTEHSHVPPVTPWAWSNVGFTSWTPFSGGPNQTLNCTNLEERGAERNTEPQNPGNHEKRKRAKKKYKT